MMYYLSYAYVSAYSYGPIQYSMVCALCKTRAHYHVMMIYQHRTARPVIARGSGVFKYHLRYVFQPVVIAGLLNLKRSEIIHLSWSLKFHTKNFHQIHVLTNIIIHDSLNNQDHARYNIIIHGSFTTKAPFTI